MFSNRGEIVDQISISHNLDEAGTDEKIMITKYKKDDVYKYYLEIGGGSDLHQELEGFEKDVTFCDKEVLELDKKNIAICVSGYVGAHSKNLQIIRYQSNELSAYQYIKEDEKTTNIYSDSPNFDFYDYNSDESMDLIIDYRDYEKNPLEDILRMYYYFDTDRGFVYDQMEEVNQSSSSINGEGQIN